MAALGVHLDLGAAIAGPGGDASAVAVVGVGFAIDCGDAIGAVKAAGLRAFANLPALAVVAKVGDRRAGGIGELGQAVVAVVLVAVLTAALIGPAQVVERVVAVAGKTRGRVECTFVIIAEKVHSDPRPLM